MKVTSQIARSLSDADGVSRQGHADIHLAALVAQAARRPFYGHPGILCRPGRGVGVQGRTAIQCFADENAQRAADRRMTLLLVLVKRALTTDFLVSAPGVGRGPSLLHIT